MPMAGKSICGAICILVSPAIGYGINVGGAGVTLVKVIYKSGLTAKPCGIPVYSVKVSFKFGQFCDPGSGLTI